jgi:hypothetical protein
MSMYRQTKTKKCNKWMNGATKNGQKFILCFIHVENINNFVT